MKDWISVPVLRGKTLFRTFSEADSSVNSFNRSRSLYARSLGTRIGRTPWNVGMMSYCGALQVTDRACLDPIYFVIVASHPECSSFGFCGFLGVSRIGNRCRVVASFCWFPRYAIISFISARRRYFKLADFLMVNKTHFCILPQKLFIGNWSIGNLCIRLEGPMEVCEFLLKFYDLMCAP